MLQAICKTQCYRLYVRRNVTGSTRDFLSKEGTNSFNLFLTKVMKKMHLHKLIKCIVTIKIDIEKK